MLSFGRIFGETKDLSLIAVCLIGLTLMGQEDFGDAPDSYGTLLAANGARHIIVPAISLGLNADNEPDDQPTFRADGDDQNPPAATATVME